MSIRITGVLKTLSKINIVVLGSEVRDFLSRSLITVEGKARENAPVDTGRLRSSIGHSIYSGIVPSGGEVGSPVEYAAFMEFGTGTRADFGGSGSAHFPPGAALEQWASRHGIESGFAVASAIGRRGGLEPRRYLRNAFDSSISFISGAAQAMGRSLARRMGGN